MFAFPRIRGMRFVATLLVAMIATVCVLGLFHWMRAHLSSPYASQEPPPTSERVEACLALPQKLIFRWELREMLDEDDLPALYAILNDLSRTKNWPRAVYAICVLEPDQQKAFATVVNHIQKVHNWRTARNRYSVPEKMLSVFNLGLLDKEVVGEFLRQALTVKGAKKVLAPWRHAWFGRGWDIELLTRLFRNSVVRALLIMQDPEMFKIVEDEYDRIKLIPPRKRTEDEYYLFVTLKGTLALRDMYADMGYEQAERLLAKAEDFADVQFLVMPYHERYDAELDALWKPEDYEPLPGEQRGRLEDAIEISVPTK